MSKNNKPIDQELIDCELRTIALINENAELRMRLNSKEQEEYDKVKNLEAQLDSLKQANMRLTEELCEWACLNCGAEYYGPSAVEKGSFKCISPECKNRYCVPKKFIANKDDMSDTTIRAIIDGLDTAKKAA